MNSVHSTLSREENEILKKYLDVYFNVFGKILNRNAPRKKKYIRGSIKPFMIKELSQTFVQKRRLRNKFLSYPSEEIK